MKATCVFDNMKGRGDGDGNNPANWQGGVMPAHSGDDMHVLAGMDKPFTIPDGVVLNSINAWGVQVSIDGLEVGVPDASLR